jgi:hypothetical protein
MRKKMKTAPRLSLAALALALAATAATPAPLTFAPAPGDDSATAAQQQQQQFGALERGYRTGYSDGYQAGYSDTVQGRPRDYRSKEDYQRADRVYLPAYGSLDDYRDGYQQGFESGYGAGFERRGFDSTVPPALRRRGAATTPQTSAPTTSSGGSQRTSGGPPVIRRDDDSTRRDDDATTGNPSSAGNSTAGAGGAGVDIPSDSRLRIELLNNISTDVSQRGDRFEARVVDPANLADAVVSGRVALVRRPGKLRGAGELQLAFEQIRLPDGRWSNLSAQVTEVVQTRTDSDTGQVDPEGGVHGRSTTKDDVTKIGAGAGVGAIIGAIAGGGAGAAIGAAIGAGVGTGGVLTTHGRDIRLQRGQQLMIRTSNDARVQ